VGARGTHFACEGVLTHKRNLGKLNSGNSKSANQGQARRGRQELNNAVVKFTGDAWVPLTAGGGLGVRL